MINTRLRLVALVVPLLLNGACGETRGSSQHPATPVAVPVISIETAHHCSGQGTCELVRQPQEIWLETGHEHDINVAVTDKESEIRSVVPDTDVVHYSEILTRTEKGGTISLTGTSLGATRLEVSVESPQSESTASLNIRTVTPRVTVVGWVDGSAIDPARIAPGASRTVRAQFHNVENAATDPKAARRCMAAVSRLLVATMSPGTPVNFLNEETFLADGLFAQASLVKSSANGQPPDSLTDDYIGRGDFRLMNDFRVVGSAQRAFARATHKLARVGNTPLPCGGADVVRSSTAAQQLAEWFDVGRSDEHELNDRRVCRNDRLTQLNEGRIGRKGREIQKLLSGSDRPADEITPWVWAAISFGRNGRFTLDTQNFPTYSVYIDGQLDVGRSVKQARFVDFTAKDASSHLWVTGNSFDRGKCP